MVLEMKTYTNITFSQLVTTLLILLLLLLFL